LEHEVVALPALDEVLLAVGDDVVCAERSDHVHVPRAAHAGHLSAEGPRDLHGEGPDASRRTDDQDLVPGLDASVVAQTLQGGQRGQGYGRRLVEREVGRFQLQEILRDGDTLSEGAEAAQERASEHLVTGAKRRDVLADRFDLPGGIATRNTEARLA
jgi:hypothetical protein